uniref:basic proline-rich protein-like n=1 Tax=Jaculus jaculus TaxID=51337 RepID=UPI001E1B458F|nr:basic proline-rich protein-like [Jaculus jaculus]
MAPGQVCPQRCHRHLFSQMSLSRSEGQWLPLLLLAHAQACSALQELTPRRRPRTRPGPPPAPCSASPPPSLPPASAPHPPPDPRLRSQPRGALNAVPGTAGRCGLPTPAQAVCGTARGFQVPGPHSNRPRRPPPPGQAKT